jgi:hypothetical protein
LNFATSSMDLFALFMLCFCPIFWLLFCISEACYVAYLWTSDFS